MSADNENTVISEYRQQQSLLPSSKSNQSGLVNSSLAHLQQQQSQVYPNVVAPSDEALIQNQGIPQQSSNLPARVANITIPEVPSAAFTNHPKLSLLLDYSSMIYCLYHLWTQPIQWNLSLIWPIYYLAHVLFAGPRKPANRKIITAIFFIQIIKYFYFDNHQVEQHQLVLFCIYIIEVIPVLFQLVLVAWMFCCVCSCACICLCCCFYGIIRSSYDQHVQKVRSSKIADQICKRNLDIDDQRQCTICLQNGGQMANMSCHHSFHPQCLMAWLVSHNTCPVCRAKLY